MFIDYLSPLKRKLLKRKLDDISRGAVQVDYRMPLNFFVCCLKSSSWYVMVTSSAR